MGYESFCSPPKCLILAFFPKYRISIYWPCLLFLYHYQRLPPLPKNGPVEEICWAPNSRCAELVPATHFSLLSLVFLISFLHIAISR